MTASQPIETLAFPLSSAQRRLWFMDQMNPGSPLYNIVNVVRLREQVHERAVATALRGVVERHESLRTTFRGVEGRPVQIVSPYSGLDFAREDLAGIARAAAEPEAWRRIHALARVPFDLGRGPLLSSRLLSLSDRESLFVFVLHHIVADAWSVRLFWQELALLYKAAINGDAPALPELPIQYSDYAVWQHERASAPELAASLEYWKGQLRDLPACSLAAERPSLATRSAASARQDVQLAPAVVEGLRQIARQEGTTLFVVLMAAWMTLLQRYTANDDVVVGTPFAGRERPETERLIGLFVNPVVLRADLGGNPSFKEVVRRVRRAVADAQSHQGVPFETLVEVLAPERDLGRPPLYQVSFQLFTPVDDGGFESVNVSPGTSAFELALDLWEGRDGIVGWLEHDTDVLDAEGATALIGHLGVLLAAVAQRPGNAISALPMLTPAERSQILADWNATEVAYPGESTIHELVEATVGRTPTRIALSTGRQAVSYAQLNARANRLARHLRELGAAPNVPIALFAERSVELVVGLLAILKSGAAYLPIEGGCPPERLRFVLDDARVSLVLTQQALEARLPPVAQIVRLDADAHRWQGEPAHDLDRVARPQDLAYVIYTSGSTGRPKGVLVTHQGLVNYASWAAKRYGAEDAAGTPLHSSLAFDLTVTSLFPPLLAGGTVRLLPADADPAALAEIPAGGPYAFVKITPAHLELVAAEIEPQAAQRWARTLVVGGEALSFSALRFWRHHAPATRVINEYGPTEAVVGCAFHQVADAPGTDGWVPIGRPIANVRLYVLDRGGQPVPVGVAGELAIGGEGLARGYLNRPEDDAARFGPDPFSKRPGARLYRTGDRCRYRRDGSLEFLGRVDDQVKIRGFRVEPAEVEGCLLAHAKVREAVVVPVGHRPARILAAYVTWRGAAVPLADLRRHLADRLPSYMLPERLLALDALPLTSHGKVDRARLPRPAQATAQREDAVAPRTTTERRVAEIYEAVLNRAGVGVRDHFFRDLGGHSLLAASVATRVREEFRVELPLRAMFESPTVEAMAALLDRGEEA